MQSLDKALKEYHDDLIKLLPPSSLMHCIKGIVNVCMTTYMELLLTSPPKLNLLVKYSYAYECIYEFSFTHIYVCMYVYVYVYIRQSLKRIKDDVSAMKNFTSFADLINEEKRCSILRPLLDVVVALEIDKSKLVTSSSIHTCVHTYELK